MSCDGNENPAGSRVEMGIKEPKADRMTIIGNVGVLHEAAATEQPHRKRMLALGVAGVCLLIAVVALLFIQIFRTAGPGMEDDEFRAVLNLLHQPAMNQENPSLLSARLGLPPQDPELSLIAKRHTKDPEVQALIVQTFIAGREQKMDDLRKNAESLRDLLPKWGIPSVILGYLSLPENAGATPDSKKRAVAESFIHEAKQKFKDARDIRGEIFSLIVEAELHRLNGQQNTAMQALDEAAESADSAGFAEIRSYVHLLKARLLKQTGQYKEALSELDVSGKNASSASKAYILTDACNERGWIALCQDLGKVDRKNAVESSQGAALRAYKIFVEAEKRAKDAEYIEGLQSALIGQWNCLNHEYLARIADARYPQPEALKAEINKLQSLRASLCSEMLDLINRQSIPDSAIKSTIGKDLAGCMTIAEQFSLFQQYEKAIAVAKEAADIAEKMDIKCLPDPKTVLHQVQERAAKAIAPAVP